MTEKIRATEFRYVYANGLKLQFSGSEVILTFGIKEDPTAPDESLREEVAIAMVPSTAKILSRTLARTFEHFEAATGVTIPIDAAREAQLEKILQDSDAASKASATASLPPS